MRNLLLLLFIFGFITSYSQEDDLLELLEEQTTDTNQTQDVINTFLATRIVDSRTVKIPAKGDLQFVIQHRFGTLKSGWREFFGIDNADIRFGLEYGATKWLSVGLGRSSAGGTWDGFAKVKFLRQTEGVKNIPLSIAWVSNVAINSQSQPEEVKIVHRVSYAHQLLIARKFTRDFSFQVMPTYVHLNLVPEAGDRNDIFAIGFGARYLVTRSIGLNVEYFQLIPKQENGKYLPSFSIGADFETGGHVFQVVLTNSTGMIEQLYLPNNTGYWWDGDIHLGFNINRIFTMVKYDKSQKKKAKRRKEKDKQW